MNDFLAYNVNRKSARRTGAPLDVFPSFSLVAKEKKKTTTTTKSRFRGKSTTGDVMCLLLKNRSNGTEQTLQYYRA